LRAGCWAVWKVLMKVGAMVEMKAVLKAENWDKKKAE
jgi:hypothetical protein